MPEPESARLLDVKNRLSLPFERSDPLLGAECIRVARRLRHTESSTFGLVPVGDSASVAPVALQLALALTEMTRQKVAYLDANSRWPFATVSPTQPSDPQEILWLEPRVAIVSAGGAKRKTDVVHELTRQLADTRKQFDCLLADLTGFDALGALEDSAMLLDKILLVARTEASSEAELLDLSERLVGRSMGVVLCD